MGWKIMKIKLPILTAGIGILMNIIYLIRLTTLNLSYYTTTDIIYSYAFGIIPIIFVILAIYLYNKGNKLYAAIELIIGAIAFILSDTGFIISWIGILLYIVSAILIYVNEKEINIGDATND